MMLSKFSNQVLAKGPAAVLPQNLSNEWLSTLNRLAAEFLDGNFSLDECRSPKDVADPLLSSSVYEILRHTHGDIVDISIEKMLEMIVIYALSIVMESADRESGIGLEPPDLDNILSIDRILSFKKINPEFVNLLKQACIVRETDKGWLHKFKQKLLSKIM